ncbi:MAG: N-acetylneuraminate synthase family protein [Planctomycetota bacterium]
MSHLIIADPGGSRVIGADEPVLLVASIGANHLGSKQHALEIIYAAAASGANAIRLDTFTADGISMDVDHPAFQLPTGGHLYERCRKVAMPWGWFPDLIETARGQGLLWFGSPGQTDAVDYLEDLDCPLYHVGPLELVDEPLLARLAANEAPVLLSTALGTLSEIAHAVEFLRSGGCPQLGLLGWAPIGDRPQLHRLRLLTQTFTCPVGLIDHSPTPTAAVAAVARGAVVIEKPLTITRADGGPDAEISMEPEEFATVAEAIRATEAACRVSAPFAFEPEAQQMRTMRKSLYVSRDMDAGEHLTPDDIACVRPADGLPPSDLTRIVGRRLRKPVRRGTPLNWNLVV